jgi:hypothetical protein
MPFGGMRFTGERCSPSQLEAWLDARVTDLPELSSLPL